MRPSVVVDGARVFLGDCRDVLKTLPDNSVDAVVTDPPYGLNFMGKEWDNPGKMLGQMATGNEQRGAYAYGGSHSRGYADNNSLGFQLWCTEWAVECLRVLKPGGHILAFGGTRTWHRLAVAVEDAGFEIRDNIAWIYGSGFPKSLNVAKSIEGKLTTGSAQKNGFHRLAGEETGGGSIGMYDTVEEQGFRKRQPTQHGARTLDATTDEANRWQGWGTALKPAFEPVVVGRKPIEGTVANNVLAWGVGGLNIDGSRIGTMVQGHRTNGKANDVYGDLSYTAGERWEGSSQGRWPANVVLDEFTAGLLDEQSGDSVSNCRKSYPATEAGTGWGTIGSGGGSRGQTDSGGASRFFYQAKASKRDRNEGLEDLETQRHADRVTDDGVGGDNPRNRTNQAKQNFHPTVKPTALMRYLIKLVTPEGGVVLDPFTGSGSTGKAALLDGYQFIGAELTEEYLPIIEGRLRWAVENRDEETLF